MRPANRVGIILWLLAFLRPFWKSVALSVLLGVLTIASGIGLLGVSAYLIASAALQPSIAALQIAIVSVRFFGISRAVFRYLERLVSHSVNFRLLAELRVWFYRALEPLAPARLQSHRSADLLSRVIADIETLENFYVRAVVPPLVAMVITICVSSLAGQYDPRLGVLLLLALLISGIVLPFLVHFLSRQPGTDLVEQRGKLNAVLLDAVQGMPDLLAFGQGISQLNRIRAGGEAINRAQRRLAQTGALANALLLLLTGLTLYGTLLLSIPLVGDRIDGVSLAVLALVVLASFEAVNPLVSAAQHLDSSLKSAGRLVSLVDAEPQVRLPMTAITLPESFDLQISNLTFRYPGEPVPALADFHLDMPAGKRIALIGPSGVGKTTLLNLLLCFWEVQQGHIKLGGQDIRCYEPEDIRRVTALISQSTYLFTGTLRQNLLIAQPSASQADLDRVIQQAQLAEVVSLMPQGLDTWIGERGMHLSGGERQRLAIARALLRDARLLLLDEPTANLDAANERRVLEVIAQISAGRSVIFVTHHLFGLEVMDEILVLQDGQVVERGKHAELLAASGRYAQMVRLQAESLRDGSPDPLD